MVEQLAIQLIDGGSNPTSPLHRKVCHQYIVKKNREEIESHDLFGKYWINVNFNNPIISIIDYNSARIMVEKYEWLGTLPVNYQHFVGLFYDNLLSGVVCYTRSKFGGLYTLFNYPAICLGRGCVAHYAPKNSSSLLISRANKMLFAKKEPTFVVAYSDWSAGEIGTIYQACNWSYLGHRKTVEWLGPDGKRYDINTPAVRAMPGFLKKKLGHKVKATKEQIQNEEYKMIKEGFEKVDGPIRGKYACVVGKKCVEKSKMLIMLEKNSKPYPKEHKL